MSFQTCFFPNPLVYVSTAMHVCALLCLQTRHSVSRFYVRTCVTHASWYCRELASKTGKKINCWIKSLFFVVFAHKKYSHSFIKLRLNHWCDMDYFNNVLTNFLGLKRVNCVAVHGGSESSGISSKKIVICVLKMNEGLTCLEQHEGE